MDDKTLKMAQEIFEIKRLGNKPCTLDAAIRLVQLMNEMNELMDKEEYERLKAKYEH